MKKTKYQLTSITYNWTRKDIFNTEREALIFEYNVLSSLYNKLIEKGKNVKWIDKSVENVKVRQIFDLDKKGSYITLFIEPVAVK